MIWGECRGGRNEENNLMFFFIKSLIYISDVT